MGGISLISILRMILKMIGVTIVTAAEQGLNVMVAADAKTAAPIQKSSLTCISLRTERLLVNQMNRNAL